MEQTAGDSLQNAAYKTGQDRTGQDKTEHNTRECVFDFELHFLQVWNAYPEKGRVKLPYARAAYNDALLPAGDREKLHADILAAISGKWLTSKQWQAEGGRFIPALDSFLRGMRWLETPEQGDAPDGEYKPLWDGPTEPK
ncbi:MAG: hypothetical protein KGL39_28850 [Patescibacteria group bacterium]|nr:hypothetical protein [Patescibacteria group bacterium]